jgi:hypothetical protein
MTQYPDVAHCATALVKVPAENAFRFLADPLSLGTWSLGCMQTRAAAPGGPYVGTSLYDDSPTTFNIQAHPDLLLIDYLVGGANGELKPRISARVIAAATCDLADDECYVSLLAWRPQSMTDERWSQLCAAHEAEIFLIKARLEGPAALHDHSI